MAGDDAAYLLALALGRAQTPATAYLIDVFGVWMAQEMLRCPQGARARRLWLLAGVLGALAVLVAPSVGLAFVGTVGLAALGRPGGWRPAVDLGLPVGVVTLLGLWVASGNSLSQIVVSFQDQIQASSGYSAAMSVEAAPGVTWLWAVLGLIAVAGVAWSATRDLPGRARAVALAGVALTAWLLLKEGFVRHDFHDLIFFDVVPYLLLALHGGDRGSPSVDRTVRPRHAPRRRSLRAPGPVLTFAFGLAVLLAGNGSRYVAPATVTTPLSSLGPTIEVLASPHRSAQLRSAARQTVRRDYDFPATWLRQIGTASVAVDPIEQAVGWAFPQLHEMAPPSVQEYVATTSTLDQHNADFYRSRSAPKFLIHDDESIDGRDPAFDAPAAQMAIRCNYRLVASAGPWTLLLHDPGRCSTPVPVGVVTTGFGRTIDVPPAPEGEALVATFELQTPLWWRFLDVALKPTRCQFVPSGAAAARFVVATGGDDHLLSFPDPSGAWALHPPRTFLLDIGGVGKTSRGVRVLFYAVAVRPGGA